jgi:glycosyltransferase involved in cell wall biosynthesis
LVDDTRLSIPSGGDRRADRSKCTGAASSGAVTRRLCIIVHGSYPIGEPRVERQAQAALGSGWDVDVVAMRREGERPMETVEGATVVRLPLRHVRGMSIAGAMREYVGFTALATATVARRHLRRRYDVVQVCNPPDFLIVAALLPKATGAGVIFDVHDLSSDMFEMRFGSGALRGMAERVLRAIERAAAWAADAVLTVHEPYRAELVRRGVPEWKTAVVMNTFDERLLPPDDVPRDAHGFRIVYHGTVTPHYGLDILVEAFASVAADIEDSRLEIYGDGDAVPALRRQVNEIGLADRVFVAGQELPHRQVLRAIRGASAGVIPNRPTKLNRYALSSKLFEYVVLGIPVVAASLPTLRAHFSDDEVLFFEAASPTSLSEALLTVATDPEGTSRRLTAASQRYFSEYRWEFHAQRYRAILDRVSRSGGAAVSG